MNEKDVFWAMLPEGLESYFEIENYEKTEKIFKIVLIEKNQIPSDLPERLQGRKVVNTLIKSIAVDFFPIKGLKGELLIKRRAWQFEGEKTLFKRDLNLCIKGTKLEKEFGAFLKEFGRKCPGSLESGGLVERYTSKDVHQTIQNLFE